MKRIYLDNAATSFPKAPGTADVIRDFLEKDCLNTSRTNGRQGTEIYERITGLREAVAGVLNLPSPESVIL
ncbi:MAG: aminotransferase class V-fold PLP-dependent enzyme, partial [Spirochaetales bacterium]|nr:aminotransferase class V-fold PLP-dependent enzyme [Spirochaetales bacterium]